MHIGYYLNKARDVKVKDYLSVFPMIAALIVTPFYKNKYCSTWAISEREDEACDNGYHFYKYIRVAHPEQPCYYVIDKKSNDYHKVQVFGNIVQYGSIRHWVLYFTCRYLISSQSFKPNGYLCTLLERTGFFHPNQVFLQHGITINKAEYLMANRRPVTYFITGANQEDQFVKEFFGYPKGVVRKTGFARFDALHELEIKKNRILIMPTWRKWLHFKSESHTDVDSNIYSSDYIKSWKQLLNNKRFLSLIEHYQLEVIFFPHPNMKKNIDLKAFANPYIQCIDGRTCDIQELMKSAELLITDYSSVFFDMAYMKKNIIFYQFDEKRFRKYHYAQGWFDYRTTNFGKFCETDDAVIDELEQLVQNHFTVSSLYLEEHRATFSLYDTNNSQRIYELLVSNGK